MRGCTIISKTSSLASRFFLPSILLGSVLLGTIAHAQAPAIPGGPPQSPADAGAPLQGPGDPNAPAIPSGNKKEDTGLFDQSSPYLEYGDFSMSEEENEDALYFQYGRFFGLSLGLGYQAALGNRGKVYDPAIPRVDIRIHYWFGFNFAMDLGVFFATHNFTYNQLAYQTKLIGYGMHLKYYFDVKDSSAALTFANPFIEGGAGQWSMSETHTGGSTIPDSSATFSVDFGGGLEFPIVHKKTYLILEALYHTESFADVTETKFNQRVPDLYGGFFTFIAHFMFVW
jgi:hypothetical protein